MGRVYNKGSSVSGRRKGKTPGPSAWKSPKGPNKHKCNWHCRRKTERKPTTYSFQ